MHDNFVILNFGNMNLQPIRLYLIVILSTCKSKTYVAATTATPTSAPTCANPPVISNGNYTPTSGPYTNGSSVSYTCDTGWEPGGNGSVTLNCTSGTWDGTPPNCTRVQCTVEIVPNTTHSPSLASLYYGSKVNYSCVTGYEHTGGNLERTCQADKTWSGLAPNCSTPTCANPPVISNGNYTPTSGPYTNGSSVSYTCDTGVQCIVEIVPNTTHSPSLASLYYGSKVNYSCVTGYEHTGGNLERTCQADKTWSGLAPNCSTPTCANPPVISNGNYTPTSGPYTNGSSVSYTCDTGWEPGGNGSITLNCTSGTWDGTPPNCTRVQCTVEIVPNTTHSPSLSSLYYGSKVNYSCVTGYENTGGNLERTCQADKTWSGLAPNCSTPTCANPPVISNGNYTPTSGPYTNGSSVSYTCDTGWEPGGNGSITLNCTSGTWDGTPPNCTRVQCTVEIVPNTTHSPSLASLYYGSKVNYSCVTGYEHTGGNLERTCQADKTWSGLALNCSMITCDDPGNVSFAFRSSYKSRFDFGDTVVYACYTGFQHTSGSVSRTCAAPNSWTGTAPVCSNITCASAHAASTFAVMTSAAAGVYVFDDVTHYECLVGYTNVSGVATRRCIKIDSWSGNTLVCTIKQCDNVYVAHASVTPDQPKYDYNTTITYTCDRAYNHTSGDLVRTCDDTPRWTGILPICTLVACLPPSSISFGTFSPVAIVHLFDTNVTYTCSTGYYISAGNNVITCQNNGSWAGTAPTCSLVRCPTEVVQNATFTPNVAQINYSNVVTYTCNLAYNHTEGDLQRTCQEDFTWTGNKPVCSRAACIQENSTFMTTIPNNIVHEFGVNVTYKCVIGYNYSSGDVTRTCLTNGLWTGSLPACTIIKCPVPAAPDNAVILPDVPSVDYNHYIRTLCNLGYYRTSGNPVRQCTEHATFTGSEAICEIIKCPSPPTILNGNYTPLEPSGMHLYNTTVEYTCQFGYRHLSGSLQRRCNELEQWTEAVPVCTIVTCPKPQEPFITFSPNTTTYDFNTTVTATCILGYNHTGGDVTQTCQHTGVFDGIPANCTIVECPAPEVEYWPVVTSPILAVYVYQDQITYDCVVGYELSSGSDVRQCTETTGWTGQPPNCTIKKCSSPPPISFGSYYPMEISGEHEFNTSVNYTCNFGYYKFSGDGVRTCNDSKQWTGATPVCKIVTCQQPSEPFIIFTPNTTTYDFNTTVTATCILGYNRTGGDVTRVCQHTGVFDGTPAICTIVECPALKVINYTTITSLIPTKYVYQDQIMYDCVIGYELSSGSDARQCTETTEWTGQPPNCTIKKCSPPPSISFGSFSPVELSGEHEFNTSVNYTCDFGYYTFSGDGVRTCNDSKQWTGATPVCKIVTCSRPSEPFITFTPDTITYDFNTTVTATCILGYNHTGGDVTRTCQHTGVFDGTPANCTIVECNAPVALNHTHMTSPGTPRYVYQDKVTYMCDIGYELTSGNLARTCTETSFWSDLPPNCTVIYCPQPPGGVRNTYEPVESEYVWQSRVNYTCDFGYEYNSGDMVSECLHNKTWSAVTPVCTIVKCNKIDVPHMMFTPPTTATHDFNTTIEYACVLGYNHSYGDLHRTCSHTGDWTGTLPNCTIITCDPPSPVPHANYTPVLIEHDWNTTIDYTCEADYHYVSGSYRFVCNESGAFPPIDLNCSAPHTLTLAPSEPEVTWLNTSVTQTTVIYDFDGLCNVTVTSSTNDLLLQLTTIGTQVHVEINSTTAIEFGTHHITLNSSIGPRTFSGLTRDVFVGEEVIDFQAWLDLDTIFLAVGEPYHFLANASHGTDVTLSWSMEANTTITYSYLNQEFSNGTLNYTFLRPKMNVYVTASNRVSSVTQSIVVDVFFKPNNINFTVASMPGNTTSPLLFYLEFMSSAKLPMKTVNITIDYSHGSNAFETRYLNDTIVLPLINSYSHLFDMQGLFMVSACLRNHLGDYNQSIEIAVWDSLIPLKFVVVNGSGKYITNTTASFEFTGVPNFGFKYTINYGDGTMTSNTTDSIMYVNYGLTTFNHVYSTAGVYTLRWTAYNGHSPYKRTGRITILVQNRVPTDGYTLAPDNKKYPWLNLQTISIPVNITLNSSVHLPTNATCVFDPDDGNTSVHRLVYDSHFFNHNHMYRNEGIFNASFNCSNAVSWYIYKYSIEVVKYNASFLSVIFEHLVPLNVSDNVTVYFHIENGGFALIPLGVNLDWDFGDSTQSSVVYNRTTYTHTYSERGDYTVKVNVTALTTNTSNSCSNPLRLGIMHFEYNKTISYINTSGSGIWYKMYGHLGVQAKFNIMYNTTNYDFCNAVNYSGCVVEFLCPQWGYSIVTATASNGTFIEIDHVNVTCDNPIIDLKTDIPTDLTIPNGTVDARLRISATALYLPVVSCVFNMGDPIKKGNYRFVQEVTYIKPFVFENFQYIAIGIHTITIYCWNLISSQNFTQKIRVENTDFTVSGLFDRYYSQFESPMYLSSMIDTGIFSRFEIKAPSTQKTHYNLWLLNVSNWAQPPNRHELLFTRGLLLPETKHLIHLEIRFLEEIENYLFEPTYVQFVMPPPHASLVGGRRRWANRGAVTVDAVSESYDPVTLANGSSLVFAWDCKALDAGSFEDAYFKTAKSSCNYSIVSTGVISLNTSAARHLDFYVVSVFVDNQRGGNASFTQTIGVPSVYVTPLSIRCTINCLLKVAVTSKLQLVPRLSNNCPGSFNWTLQEYNNGIYKPKGLDGIPENGLNSRSITISANKLEPGKKYLLTLVMTMKGDGLTYGPAYYEFVTNLPPRDGHCRVIPYTGDIRENDSISLSNSSTATPYSLLATQQKFNMTCLGWKDEGWTASNFTTDQPLLYYFYVRYSGVETEKQILYFDPGQTSNIVSFQAGDPENMYRATAIIRVSDIFGDYEEVKYILTSTPNISTANIAALPTSAERLQLVKSFVSAFDEEMIKANRTADYRTLSRRIMDITSVYNNLKLNISGIELTPEDLLSLGNHMKEGSNRSMSWEEYYKLIVEVVDTTVADYLMQVGENYAHMLLYSVKTWPSNKQMTSVSIDTISRALAATVSNKDYANVTTIIMASEGASIMADNIAKMVTQRTIPNTEQMNSAVQGVLCLIQKCLNDLQTILTPNLPQDPTVDVMRNYLEYIKIFTPGGTAALSLQEQTFLAQKQLQKYYVQKVLKSEASQKALPYLTSALRKLTDYLSQLIQLDDEKLILENELLFISAEKRIVKDVAGTALKRPRVDVYLTGLTTTAQSPVECDANQVTFKHIIFKKNPYFWGEFADRITSYVPVLQIDGAVLPNARVTYSLQNKAEAACIDKTPSYKADDADKMIYMVFDRRHAADDILFFIRPNTTGLKYDVYLRVAEKPNVPEKKFDYSTAIKTNHWTNEDGYKLLIKSGEFAGTGKIWIALRPLLGAEGSNDITLLTKQFCANVTSVSCLAWVQKNGAYVWDKDKCLVSPTSTRSVTVCDCENMMRTANAEPMTVGTTSYVPLSEIDFDNEDVDELPLGRDPVVGVILAVGSLYVLFALWAWREDQKDKYKWSYSLLIDNDIADGAFYIVSVYTGLRSASGTNSKVGFILVGEDESTDIRRMDDDSHVGFERGSVRTFVMSTRRHLGELICLRIWHDDNGGNNSSWFLNKVVVTDLANDTRYVFECNHWFDYDTGDKKVDRILTAQKRNHSYTEFILHTAAEYHLWFSVFLRPMRSNFTRVQRLSCLLGMMCITMIVSTMVIRIPNENASLYETKIGPFRFSLKNVQVALISLAVGTVVVTIASFFFKNTENNENKRYRSWVLDKYRKANARLNFDPSVVGREFVPPAEDALQYNYFFLPHYCIYVGWMILVMSVVVSMSLTVIYSDAWELIKSEEWMTTVCISVLCSMFVTEVIKVACFILVYAIMCPRVYEPPDPVIDVDNLEEITKRNSATLNIGPHFQRVLPLPKIPDAETLINNQINRIRNHQLFKIVSQLVLYSGLLYIVYKISYESRDPRSFDLKNHVSKMFTFSKVTDLPSYIKWLDTQFKDNFFSKTYFGAGYDAETRPYTEDLVNFRVGPARLRQLRITPERCKGPLATEKPCHNRFIEKKKQTTDYCKDWAHLPCPVAEKSTSLTSSAWLYTSSDEAWGFPTYALYNTYGGGGYFMKLDVNSDVSQKIFVELEENNWFDNQTRAVILEFSLYNANANLFVYAKFVGEFPEMGGFLPYSTISVFRLYLHNGPDGNFIMFLELMYLLITLLATMNIAFQIFTDPKTFFKSVWNILDILALIMSYVSTIMFLLKLGIIEKTIKVFQEDKNEYIGFENLEFYDFITNTAFGILVFILSIRISRILGYSGRIHEMAAVISNAADDLLGFLFVFSIATTAYVNCGNMLFGRDEGRFKSWYDTFGTITETFIGKNKVDDIMKAQPIYAEIYYITFVLFVLMTLVTMAAAILNFSISHVKEETVKLAPSNIVEVIWDRIVVLAGKLQRTIKTKKVPVVRRDSESELREILSDLHLFIRNLKERRKSNKADKYRPADDED